MNGIPSRQELAIPLKEGLNRVIGSEIYAMNPSTAAFDGLVDAIRKTLDVQKVQITNMYQGSGEARFFICQECGHTELFLMERGTTPRLWE